MAAKGAGKRKPGKTTRKIEMKKIENIERRETTFSKRRQGLFSKASELSLLCGAEVAIIVYSPRGDQPYVFGRLGTSSAEAIFERFLGLNPTASNDPSGEDHLSEYREWERNSFLLLDEARKKAKLGPEMRWWDDSIEDLQDVEELVCYIEYMERLREKVRLRIEELRSADDGLSEYRQQGGNSLLVSHLDEATKQQNLGEGTKWGEDPNPIIDRQDVEELERCYEWVEKQWEEARLSVKELRSVVSIDAVAATPSSDSSTVADLHDMPGSHGEWYRRP